MTAPFLHMELHSNSTTKLIGALLMPAASPFPWACGSSGMLKNLPGGRKWFREFWKIRVGFGRIRAIYRSSRRYERVRGGQLSI